ncbi:MAG: hypothetical protein Q9227_005993 [Pyrenula ochraceoflavens]
MSGSSLENAIRIDDDSDGETQIPWQAKHTSNTPSVNNPGLAKGILKNGLLSKTPHKPPLSSTGASPLFHSAKKPDNRPADRKPIIYTSHHVPATTRLIESTTSSASEKVDTGAPPKSQPVALSTQNKRREETSFRPTSPERIGKGVNVLSPAEHDVKKLSSLPLQFKRPSSAAEGPEVPDGNVRILSHDASQASIPPESNDWRTLSSRESQVSVVHGNEKTSRYTPIIDTFSDSEDVRKKSGRPVSQRSTPLPSALSTNDASRASSQNPGSLSVRPSHPVVEIDNSLSISRRKEYHDVNRKRFHEGAGEGSAKRLRRGSSSESSIISHRQLHLFYAYDEDDDKRKRLGQLKVKKVDRRSISLDLKSEPDPGVLSALSSLRLNSFLDPQVQAQRIQGQKFEGIANLTFTNNMDGSQLHGKFQFTHSYIPGDLKVRKYMRDTHSEEFYAGCGCKVCDSDSCECIAKEDIENDFEEIEGEDVIRTYQINPDYSITLRDDFMARENPVIKECNEVCGCGPACMNRLVQRGRTVHLDIFKTPKCGFGELVSERTLDLREDARIAATPETQPHTSYIFSLDKFEDDVFHVDGTNYGSPMRFVNHSCEPNCRVFTVIPDPVATKVYGLAFFTTRDIPAGTELTIDYDPSSADKIHDPKKIEPDMWVCHCGSRRCRRLLWPEKTANKRRGRPKK